MISNRGITQTTTYNNCNYDINQIEWNADYNGNTANIDIDYDENGKKKHLNFILNNDDLAEIFNIPSVNDSLDRRLKNDFKKNKRTPMFIEVDNNEINSPITIQPLTHMKSSLLENYLPVKYNTPKRKYTHRRNKKNKHKTPKTMRVHLTN
jgi:hypothetical protein